MLGPIRGLLSFLALAACFVTYVLMAVTPMIPKRFFLPLTLFTPVGLLAVVPVMIYHFAWLKPLDLFASFGQLSLGLGILYWVQGGFRFRWPLLPEDKLGERRFGWLNSLGFVLVNVFLLLPAVVFYLALSASLAVNHFSAGFVSVHSNGVTVSAKKFVRGDGKSIQLVPMAHIGEASFYKQIAQSFPTNSIVLLEGVTDQKHLIKQELSYKRAAASLNLTEQQKEFEPTQGELRQADIDVQEFSAGTLELLNIATRLHSKGLSVPTLLELIQKSQNPRLTEQLDEDLLTKRNQHLLKEIETALQDSEHIVVPWGAAHMPGIAREIQQSGFVMDESREYVVVNFRSLLTRSPAKRE